MRDLVLKRHFGRGATVAMFPLHQAACLAWSKAADEALLSLMRYTRPLSVCSETRLRPSFLRTIPARKPRTECCCQSVAAMIAAIVAPAGVRSIAMMRACLVLGRVGDLDAASTDCGARSRPALSRRRGTSVRTADVAPRWLSQHFECAYAA